MRKIGWGLNFSTVGAWLKLYIYLAPNYIIWQCDGGLRVQPSTFTLAIQTLN